MYLGFGGELVGILLWPVIAIHAVLALLFAYVWLMVSSTSNPVPNSHQTLRFTSASGTQQTLMPTMSMSADGG